MSYSESNGQVTLTMSRDDYDALMIHLGHSAHDVTGPGLTRMLAFMNRLNEGNPHYTPYQVEANK